MLANPAAVAEDCETYLNCNVPALLNTDARVGATVKAVMAVEVEAVCADTPANPPEERALAPTGEAVNAVRDVVWIKLFCAP